MVYGNRRPGLKLAAAAVGFGSLLVQVSLIRELLISLKGNELHIGVIACIWLGAGSAGSFTGALLRVKIRDRVLIPGLLILGTVTAAISFPAARYIREFFPFHAYVPGAFESLIWTCAVVVPVSLVFGSAAGAVLSGRSGKETAAYYMYEAAGITAGGLLFTFVFTQFASVTHGILFVLLCTAAVCIALLVRRKYAVICLFCMLAVVYSAVLVSGAACGVDLRLRSKRYGQEEVLLTDHSRSTPYGDIDVTGYRGQTNVYHNGIGTGYSGTDLGTEEVGAAVNLIQPEAGSMLIIGGAVSRIPQNILKWGAWHIHALEIDPEIARMRSTLGFPEVRIIESDPVSYPETADMRYNGILIRILLPSTLVLNRVYTSEYFIKLRSLLKTGGVLYAVLDRPPDFAPLSYRNMMRSLFLAASGHFIHSAVLVMDQHMIWIFSEGRIPGYDTCMERFLSVMKHAKHVSPLVIEEGFRGSDAEQWRRILSQGEAEPNSAGRPRAVKHYLSYWLSVQHGGGSVYLPDTRHVWAAGFAAVLICLSVFALSRPRTRIYTLFPVMGLTGLTGMAYEMCIAYLFQMEFGSLYSSIGILFASFMLGSCLGARAGAKAGRPLITRAVYIQSGIALLCGATALFWRRAACWYALPFMLNFLIGYGVGIEFALFSRILSRKYHRAGGILYGFDLAGGALGGIITGLYLIPYSDIGSVCGWLCAVSVAGAGAVACAGRKG